MGPIVILVHYIHEFITIIKTRPRLKWSIVMFTILLGVQLYLGVVVIIGLVYVVLFGLRILQLARKRRGRLGGLEMPANFNSIRALSRAVFFGTKATRLYRKLYILKIRICCKGAEAGCCYVNKCLCYMALGPSYGGFDDKFKIKYPNS